MSMVSFSGPLRVGTQRDANSSRNTGLVKLVQTATVSSSAITTSPSAQNLFVLPAGAKIIRFNVEVVTTISGGSVSAVAFTIGNTSSANAYMTSTSLAALTVGALSPVTAASALQVAATNNIGTSDVQVTGTFTATTGNPTAGSVVVTVEYIQRNADGTANPASA